MAKNDTGMNGPDDDDDKIDPRDDVMTQVLKFLQGKLSDADLSTVETCFQNKLDADGNLATDARPRRGMLRLPTPRQLEARAGMFPNGRRLR